MRKTWLGVLVLLLVGCLGDNKTLKYVTEKPAPIQLTMAVYDANAQGYIRQTHIRYYLIASDGSRAMVTKEEHAEAKVGEFYRARFVKDPSW